MLSKISTHFKRSTAIAIALILILQSCTKDADVKLPEVPSKVVINSFISPQDSLIKVYVSLSQPLYNTKPSENYISLPDASVIIKSIFGSYALKHDAKLKCYVIDSTLLKIRADITYSLFVKTLDGKEVSSITTIPSANNSFSYTLVTDSVLKPIQCTWRDPSTPNDYYRVFLAYKTYALFEGVDNGVNFADTIYIRGVEDDEFILDTDNQGGVFTKKFSADNAIGEANDTSSIILHHVSKEYYDYHIKLFKALRIGNPFAEPVQMYSNVNFGVGVFAGYNQNKIKLFK